MTPHLAIVMITAALAGCAVCAEPYDVGPYGIAEYEAAPPAPVRTAPLAPARPNVIERAPLEEPPMPERQNKTQGM